MAILLDSHARERAATAGDRNIVVTAGAGTGKTTLLVDRLLHLVLCRHEPLSIADIVALTFTNKAADEMKLRLRARLTEFSGHELASTALRELEKSQIGTIHSFAAHLLRLYPIESRVDPGFRQDDGREFDAFFRREWTLWLDQELGSAGSHDDVWIAALSAVTLEDVQDLARGLAGELIPLEECLDSASDADHPSPPLRGWLLRQAHTAGQLRQSHPKINMLERMLDDASVHLEQVARHGARHPPAGLLREIPGLTKAWSRDDYEEARRIVRVAQAVTPGNLDLLQPLVRLLVPFARECRRRFVHTGFVSFDGLVARARNLLRDHPSIRRELKHRFRSILVDEFQDTDPVQYEMILYLAETRDMETSDWQKVTLEPGKLFIVGDPKQSIYAFRRADMEAYDAVVEDHVLAQPTPGERQTLQTNFRSHAGLLASINGLFSRLFPAEAVKGLQPKHDPLMSFDTAMPLSGEQVEIRLVRADDPDADAETAGRAEAEELARWLREEVFHHEEIMERGVPVKIKPGHVAILFRTLTDMRDYLEALRRYHIPCLTEGEKHFYERQEVLDAINLLRAAVDPHDRMALVAVLRSSLGALTDVQIESLSRHRLLDYRIVQSQSPDGEAKAAYDAVASPYALLRELSSALPHLPPTDVMDALMSRAPLLELAAASVDGEQAVANVLKLRDLAVQLAKQSTMTLRGFVGELTNRALEVPDEAESSLAEDLDGEGEGFVRLLSIHKAKGLEFPVVILAGLQRGTNRIPSRTLVHHDWSTGIVGIKVGPFQTLGGIYVASKLAERQRAEQSRVLYVAMTRAKRRLILSAGVPKQVATDSFLAMVAQGFGLDLATLDGGGMSPPAPGGATAISVKTVHGRTLPLHALRREGAEWKILDDDVAAVRARWEARVRRRDEAAHRSPILSPTRLQADQSKAIKTGRHSTGRGAPIEIASVIGTLAHRILETWDFSDDPIKLSEQVDEICKLECMEIEQQSAEIQHNMKDMLEVFRASPIYRTLQEATILGREVPFAIPWPDAAPQHSVMEGIIDLVYRFNGDIWIADYKTDRITEEQVVERADAYRLQAKIYTEAVSRCIGSKPKGFQLIFLRSGTVVPIVL